MLFVALLHCCTAALYCIIVRMREFDTKFLAGILILVNLYKNTYIRIPARNFVSNSRNLIVSVLHDIDFDINIQE